MSAQPNFVGLSDREMQVLRLLLQEKTSAQIAEQLFISKRTVDSHRMNILDKTGCKTVIGLYKLVQNSGLEL